MRSEPHQSRPIIKRAQNKKSQAGAPGFFFLVMRKQLSQNETKEK